MLLTSHSTTWVSRENIVANHKTKFGPELESLYRFLGVSVGAAHGPCAQNSARCP